MDERHNGVMVMVMVVVLATVMEHGGSFIDLLLKRKCNYIYRSSC